jgi:hypothetical protein
MFIAEATRNIDRGSMWDSPMSAVRVIVFCLTFMMLKSKSSMLLEISSAGLSGEDDEAFISFPEFVEKVK